MASALPSDPTSVPPDTDFEIARVERSVHVDAPVDEVWSTIAEPDELSEWLGARVELDRPVGPGAAGEVVDADGSIRHLLVTGHSPGRRLAWHWWRDGDELSSVEITVRPDGDGTEVRVVIETVALATVTTAARPPSRSPRISCPAWTVRGPPRCRRYASRLSRKLIASQ